MGKEIGLYITDGYTRIIKDETLVLRSTKVLPLLCGLAAACLVAALATSLFTNIIVISFLFVATTFGVGILSWNFYFKKEYRKTLQQIEKYKGMIN